jgi:hypothetical protein
MFTRPEASGVTLAAEPKGKTGQMPQIIVTAERPGGSGEEPVMFRERVNIEDFESGHFAAQLVERIGWAVGDAAAVEQERDQR